MRWHCLIALVILFYGCTREVESDTGVGEPPPLMVVSAAVHEDESIKEILSPDRDIQGQAHGQKIARFNPNLTPEDIYLIGEAVQRYSSLYELPPYLVIAVIIVESSGRPDAVSPKGAIGLMQVMPYMAKELGYVGDLFSIDTNIRLGTFILADNIQRWGLQEGLERFFWGTGKGDGIYLARVLEVLKEVER